MTPDILILVDKDPTSEDRSIFTLVKHYGINPAYVNICDYEDSDPFAKIKNKYRDTKYLAFGISCLKKVFKNINKGSEGSGLAVFSAIYMYGVKYEDDHANLIRTISEEKIAGLILMQQGVKRWEFVNREERFMHGLSGISFDAEVDDKIICFETNNDAGNIITANKKPYFLSFSVNNAKVFLSGCQSQLNVEVDSVKIDLTAQFHKFLAAIIFLKHCFGDSIWHNNSQKSNIIIDDPLLRESYGNIKTYDLIKYLKQSGVYATIAFIPWNYKRSDLNVVKSMSKCENLSVCVHGTDHTKDEYGNKSESELLLKINRSIERMEKHREKYLLPYQKIMVFPQGIFSAVSMKCLKSKGFLAAVNTEAFPKNEKKEVLLADFLKPAIMNYEGFPLFTRRRSWDVINAALDRYLSKPALFTFHNENFRHGFSEIQNIDDFCKEKYKSCGWDSLENIIKRSYLERADGGDRREYRIFTNEAFIENQLDVDYDTEIKVEQNTEGLKSIKINGRKVEFYHDGSELKVFTRMAARGKYEIQIEYENDLKITGIRKNIVYESRVAARRYLSELRDESPLFGRIVDRIKNAISA